MTTKDIAILRDVVRKRTNGVRTHWEDCWLESTHRDCAIMMLLDYIEAMRQAAKDDMQEILAVLDSIRSGPMIDHDIMRKRLDCQKCHGVRKVPVSSLTPWVPCPECVH